MKIWRITKRVLIGLLAALFLVVLSAFIIIRYYEDDVVAYALEKVKEGLVTKMDIGEADLTFWSTFPNASIRFKDVFIEETFEQKDTLAFIGELNLGFSLSDLFSGDYKVHDIVADRAIVRMKVDERGADNWHFWKNNEKDSTSVAFEIKDVELTDFSFLYENRKSKFFGSVNQSNLDAEGFFSTDTMEFDVELETHIESIISGEDEWMASRKTALIGKFKLDLPNTQMMFADGTVELDDLRALLNLNYQYGDKSYVDAHLQGDNIDLDRVRKFLPAEMASTMESYELGGKMNLNASIKGPTYGKMSPNFHLNFVLSKGEMTDKTSGTSLTDVSAQAIYTANAGKKDMLNIESLTAQLGAGHIHISGIMEELQKPFVNLDVSASAHLDDVRTFFALDTLEYSTGQMNANANVSGRVGYKDDGSIDWSVVACNGTASLNDANIKLKGSSREFSQMNGTFLFADGNASVQNFVGLVSGSDFKIDGTMNNLIPYLTTPDAVLEINASLLSSHVNVNELLEKNTKSQSAEVYSLNLPKRVKAKFNATFSLFEFRQFKATEVRGVIEADETTVRADPITFKTAGGNWLTQFGLQRIGPSTYNLRCHADLQKINISDLFIGFENFGQTFITDKNLKGIATASVNFESQMTSSLDLIDESIVSIVDISIENGQLVNLESLQSIAAYIKGNKWVAPFVNEDLFTEKLKDVKFSKFENVIEIKNRRMVIPLMEIKSSAMDISARGTHSFDGQIDYTIGFGLRDLLVRKGKEWAEEDDGLGRQMYLYMRGTSNNPEFGLDKQASKQSRQEEIVEEKKNVKALLKEEFGLFRKDTSVGTYKTTEHKPGTTMSVEWNENDQPKKEDTSSEKKPESKTATAEPDVKKPAKKVPKWLQEKDDPEYEDED